MAQTELGRLRLNGLGSSEGEPGSDNRYGEFYREFDPDRFVGRKKIISPIIEKVLSLRDYPAERTHYDEFPGVPRSVFNIVGRKGMGKTSVLETISTEVACLQENPESRHVIVTEVDMLNEDGKKRTLKEVILDWQNQLNGALPDGVEPIAHPIFTSSDKAFRHKEARNTMLTPLARRLQELYDEGIVLLCMFDNVPYDRVFGDNDDNNAPSPFDVLLEPLIIYDRHAVVLASEMKSYMHNFQVRRRRQNFKLEPLSRKEMHELLEDKPTADAVRELSLGHPAITHFIEKQFEELGIRPEESENFFLEYREELSNILKRALDYLFKGVTDPQTRKMIEKLATLRSFFISSMQQFLAETDLNAGLLEKNDNYFQRLIEKLCETELVYWPKERHGYAVDPTTCHIANLWLKMSNPDEYILRQGTALEMYVKWIEGGTTSSIRHLVEAAYHMGIIAKAKPDRSAHLQTDFSRLLDLAYNKTESAGSGKEWLDALQDKVVSDDELRQINPDFYNMIVKSLTKLRGEFQS